MGQAVANWRLQISAYWFIRILVYNLGMITQILKWQLTNGQLEVYNFLSHTYYPYLY